MPSPPAAARPSWHAGCWLLAAGLIALTAVVYLPVFGHAFVSIDDHIYVTDNPHVLAGLSWQGIAWAFTTGHANFWHPLTWLSLMLDAQLFGPGPFGFHATNFALHLVSTLLLFVVLLRTTGACYPSAFAAALFGLHPLHVESVAWVSERKDALSTCLMMGTLAAYAVFAARRRVGALAPWRAWYAGTLALFTLGLMAKPMLVTLPFVLLLLDWWPLGRLADAGNRKAVLRGLIVEKAPLIGLALVAAGVAVVAQQRGGAVASLESFPLPLRAANAIAAPAAYVVKMLWPSALVPFYPYPQSIPWWPALAGLALVAAGSVVAYWQRRERPWLAVGWLWYLGMLVPVSGLVQVGSHAMADRYTYVPMIGLFLAVAWLGWEWCRSAPVRRWVAAAAAVAVVAACAGTARAQVLTWHDSLTLWQHAVDVSPANYYAHNALGLELVKLGRGTEAAAHFEAAIGLAPGSPNAHNNLGRLLGDQGRVDEAIAEYRKALEVAPDFAQAHLNLGIAMSRKGRANDAIGEFTAVLEHQPDSVEARVNLGRALLDAGRTAEAIDQARLAVAASPRSAVAHYSLANALEQAGRFEEAVAEFEPALALGAGMEDAEVRTNFGVALLRLGRDDEAAGQFEAAIKAAPRSAKAHNDLGTVWLRKGRAAEALAQFRAATDIDPMLADAHMNAGSALADLGQLEQAESEYRRAVELAPRSADVHFNLADMLVRRGRHDEAIREYEAVLELEGRTADVLAALGVAFERAGRLAEARRQFEAALQLRPDLPAAAAGLARLRGR